MGSIIFHELYFKCTWMWLPSFALMWSLHCHKQQQNLLHSNWFRCNVIVNGPRATPIYFILFFNKRTKDLVEPPNSLITIEFQFNFNFNIHRSIQLTLFLSHVHDISFFPCTILQNSDSLSQIKPSRQFPFMFSLIKVPLSLPTCMKTAV